MHIDKKLISRLEDLAMLKLSDKERDEVLGDLNEILSMIEKLEEFDTGDAKAKIHMTDVVNYWRKDEIGEHLDRRHALNNAKSKNNQFFIVPKVIK